MSGTNPKTRAEAVTWARAEVEWAERGQTVVCTHERIGAWVVKETGDTYRVVQDPKGGWLIKKRLASLNRP